MDSLHFDAEFLRCHLDYLRMQTLAHFSAAMRDQDSSVCIHMDQRACLVQVFRCEANTELDRQDGNTPLAPSVSPV